MPATPDALGPSADDIADVALQILPAMLNSRSGLFAHKTLLLGGDYDNRGENPFYSAIALVGLLEQRLAAADRVIPLGRALDGLHSALTPSASPALLGVGVWASCLAGDRRGESLTRELGEALASPRWSSMELGLGLSGLVAAFRAYPGLRDRCGRWAEATAATLLRRVSAPADLFRGSRRTTPRNVTQPNLTSFASQVYPMHGLAQFAHGISHRPPDPLARVAGRLVASQGPLGQWWWFYSTRSGAVLEGYPVYSVHQDGMAFMALTRPGELAQPAERMALARGVAWLLGANELGMSLVRRNPPFIARCVQRVDSDADGFGGISRSNRVRLVARSLLRSRAKGPVAADPQTLEPLEECRSYHLGWLLYANRLLHQSTR